jgi:hypothetical protein
MVNNAEAGTAMTWCYERHIGSRGYQAWRDIKSLEVVKEWDNDSGKSAAQ